jgi:hypothetical protein
MAAPPAPEPCSVGYHREERNAEGVLWACVLAILSVGARFQCPAPSRRAGLGVRVLPGDIQDELAVADDAGDVAVFRELEVGVALFGPVSMFLMHFDDWYLHLPRKMTGIFHAIPLFWRDLRRSPGFV